MKYVVGGTYRAALEFCRIHGIKARDKNTRVFTASQVARGALQGVRLGTGDEIYTSAISLATYEDASKATQAIDIITNLPRS